MGRGPSSSKEGNLNRGAWTAIEDQILKDYVAAHGDRRWSIVAKEAGLNRCSKSCRLRWLNYLRPDIKRGNITPDEEDLIIRLHNLLGNRWSLIAGRLPGRTDNEIKNYWHTNLAKREKSNKLGQSVNDGKQKRSVVVKNPEKPIKLGEDLCSELGDSKSINDLSPPDFETENNTHFSGNNFDFDFVGFGDDCEISLLDSLLQCSEPQGPAGNWSFGFASEEEWMNI